MDRVPIAIVGCGGMGGRHLLGLKELHDTELCNVELVAACDLRRDNAEHLADDAERLLGKRPLVFERMEAMVEALPDLQGVDITTDSGSHHAVASEAFDLGLHVLCEKPLAVTIRGCNMIMEAQRRAGKVLSVAEQFRRDPMCRLTKAVLDAGIIGDPYMLFQISAGGGNQIIILPWRHDKNQGGIVVDAGVHTCDLMQYYMGDAREIYAHTALYEPVRYKGSRIGVAHFYEHWVGEVPDEIEATAVDSLVSLIRFESGATGQWTTFVAAHGRGFSQSGIYGSEGSLHSPGARNGGPVTVCLDRGGELTGDAVLHLVPDFHLDPTTARLFGEDRWGSYDFTFPEADRKLVAVEYQEFGECIETGRRPEVDAYVGRKALALVNAALESGVLNRPVTLEEVESERTAVYQAEVNAYWGI
ncbi:MAG: Gfo/Idh/MocA family oxidoreductase [Anaerolineae bacterium]|nr:Gfo/Idh/MocA family oxidoreductase [Anaerolineae bacterium]